MSIAAIYPRPKFSGKIPAAPQGGGEERAALILRALLPGETGDLLKARLRAREAKLTEGAFMTRTNEPPPVRCAHHLPRFTGEEMRPAPPFTGELSAKLTEGAQA